MKKKFNKFALVQMFLCILTVAFALPSLADNAEAISVGATNVVTAASTTTANMGSVIKMDKQKSLGFVQKFQGNGSATDNVVSYIARSYDGTTFETTPPLSLKFTNALANTTAVVGYHEIPESLLANVHSVKVLNVQSYASTVNGTNAAFYFVKKKQL